MLKSLDILIGLSVVMLIVSMAVTLINQAILSAIAARGRCLQEGLADLLQHLDTTMPRQTAEDIAAMVLTEPNIRRTKLGPLLGSLFPYLQFGEVIHREELTKILLDYGARQNEIKERLNALEKAIAGNVNGAEQQKVADAVETLCCATKSITGVWRERLQEIEKILEEINGTKDQGRQTLALNKLDEMLTVILGPLGKMAAALNDNGIPEPGKTLDNVRMMALQMEKDNPELASSVNQNAALLQEASSPFLAKINLAFDQTMDRVSARFTGTARVVTLFSAVVVAVALQLDAINIVNHLAVDDKLREGLVLQATKIMQDEDLKKAVQPTADSGSFAGPAPAHAAVAGGSDPTKEAQPGKPAQATGSASDAKDAEVKTRYYMNFLAEQGLLKIPTGWADWLTQWNGGHIPGVLLSILLLSLGAPFWYKAIAKLLQLRSVLAQKDDEQRSTRQTTQTPETTPKPGPPAASPPSPQGERGDLKATV